MRREKMIVPAIIAKTQTELEEKIGKVKDYVDLIQLDVMDGRFVPNSSIDFDFKLPDISCSYEAHLMVSDPETWVEKNYLKVDTVLAHFESCEEPYRVLELVKSKNKRFGFVLNPS